MLLTELEEGAEILIKSYYYEDTTENEKLSINFTANVIKVFPNTGIITSEMQTEEGVPVNFESMIVCSDVYYIRDDAPPIAWHNVRIIRTKMGDRRVHGITTPNVGVKFNRRGCYRVFVGRPGTLQLGVGQTPIDIQVKNVSESGIAVIVPAEVEVVLSSDGLIKFDDFGFHIEIEGLCIRRQPIDKTSYIAAFINQSKNADLAKYIADKQRDKVK